MFTGKLHHGRLMEKLNSIKLELFECDEVRIDFCGSNTHLFNRIFAVIDSDGASVISGCGKSYTLQKDCIYFLSAGEKYNFTFTSATLFISFHFNFFCGEGLEFFTNVPFFEEEKNERQWIEKLKQCMQQGDSFCNAFIIHNLLMDKLLKYTEKSGTDIPYQNAADIAVFKYLQEKATAVTVIDDLAEIAGCSSDSLSRYFSKKYKMTLKKILDRAVCARAERLLRNRDLKIRDVAKLLKFKNEFYFNTFFKRETGKTPGSFRENISGNIIVQW